MTNIESGPADVVIIGAGISGLVCGCSLAKAGMKVVIAEQHFKPGGYCTSFKRNGFTFDAAAHCFGSYRNGGITRKIFDFFDITRTVNIRKCDPSDTVITPDYRISFWSELDRTIEDVGSSFPHQAGPVRKFFTFLLAPDPSFFSRMRKGTFKDLLAFYFTDEKLKAVLAAPLLGLGGLPPSLMSAFVGAKIYSEFLLDGGYLPEGGMQQLSNALADRFKEFGGTLLLSCRVKKIEVSEQAVAGVTLENGDFLRSRFVVSNCDARQTFLKLLDRETIDRDFISRIDAMTPSISNFIAYIGIDRYFDSLPKAGTNICFFPHYDIESSYQAIEEGNLDKYGGHMFYISKEVPTILAIVPAPYRSKSYWENNKEAFLNSFIQRMDRSSIPGLKNHILYQEAATPATLERYTANYHGASFGWAGTVDQLAIGDFKRPRFIKGLYLTGHWTTHGLGISGGVYVGHDTARMILKGKAKKSF